MSTVRRTHSLRKESYNSYKLANIAKMKMSFSPLYLTTLLSIACLCATTTQAKIPATDLTDDSLFAGLRSVKLTNTHREIMTSLKQTRLPSAARLETPNTIDLSSYTPFCNGNLSTPISSISTGLTTSPLHTISPQCVRWEEQEVDMLLMYIDLLAVGMKQTLAEEFYKQIRCLSRANIVPVPHYQAWQVCFTADYSQHIGTLLSNYVNQDFKLNPPVENTDTDTDSMSSTTRRSGILSRQVYNNFGYSSAPVTDANRGSFLLFAFNDNHRFRIYRSADSSQARYDERVQTSCCESCTESTYFVNIEKNQCVQNPFGKHCCHNACKSLGRLRVGASTSVSYCCQRCNPLPCKQSS